MNGYICSDERVVPDAGGAKPAGDGHVPTLVGTFLLRRANYFTETGMPETAGCQATARVNQSYTVDVAG